MNFDSGYNNSMERTEEGREKGVWTDHTTQPNRYDDLLNAVYDRTDFEDRDEINVLDVGASTGEAPEYFAEHLEQEYDVDVNVVGLDVGNEALQEASGRVDHAVQGAAQHLPFGKDEFDVVTSKTVLSRLGGDDQSQALREIGRVMDSDGYAAVQVDPEGLDRVVTGNSYIMTGEEMEVLSEETDGFTEYSVGESLEPFSVLHHQPEGEEVEDVEKHKEGEFLGTTRHVAEEYEEQEAEDDSEDDFIIGS